MVREQDERLHTYLEHGGEPDDEAPVHLHLLLLVAVHHSGGHDLVKVPGGVADDGGDVADDDADEVEHGEEEHAAGLLQASPNDADKSWGGREVKRIEILRRILRG